MAGPWYRCPKAEEFFEISLNRSSPIRYDPGNDEQPHRTSFSTVFYGRALGLAHGRRDRPMTGQDRIHADLRQSPYVFVENDTPETENFPSPRKENEAATLLYARR